MFFLIDWIAAIRGANNISVQCMVHCWGSDFVVVFFSFLPTPFLCLTNRFQLIYDGQTVGEQYPRGRNTAQALPHVSEKSKVLAGNTCWDNKIVRKAGPLKGHGEDCGEKEGWPLRLRITCKYRTHVLNLFCTYLLFVLSKGCYNLFIFGRAYCFIES